MRVMEAADCGSSSYYGVLGLRSGCSIDEIRRAYRKLAMVSVLPRARTGASPLELDSSIGSMTPIDKVIVGYLKYISRKWHPDKCVKNPSRLSKAKRKFQQIQEAYAVLSDQRKRTRYDAGVQDFDDDDDEDDKGMCDFMQELWSLMAEGKKRKEKSYSLEELQGMLKEMAKGFSWSSDCEITQCSQGLMF